MSYYPTPKKLLNTILNPDASNNKERASSEISTLLFSSHILICLLFYSVSLMSLTTFAILIVNYSILAYSAGAVSAGYAYKDNEENDEHDTDKKFMSICTLTFLLTGILPFIYLKILAPSIVAIYYLPIMFYSFIALATYINFNSTPSGPSDNLLENLKGFLKTKVFTWHISLISFNKHRAETMQNIPQQAIKTQVQQRDSSDFGGGTPASGDDLTGTIPSAPPLAEASLYPKEGVKS
ncbi:MAG: hypothetical protein HON78_01415 [Legionellales bacterium]|nr:hypothetical protein [Legionellales bacterium]